MFLSLTNWQVVGDWQFVGLDNYQNIASGQDNLFNESLRVTFIYSFSRVPLVQVIALGWPSCSTSRSGRAVFRTIFFLPAVTAGVATAYLWGYLFSGQVGLVNNVLACSASKGRTGSTASSGRCRR